ncbi:hypothetical protein BGY98DRAFT_437828 [Russula aff. rugulosa BPL654]|nr:hypothetical protein BGY98DRAFT_437828 [Russula aff. rugulosa BPL654]
MEYDFESISNPALTPGTHTATHLERCFPCIYHEQRVTTRSAQKVGKQTQMVSITGLFSAIVAAFVIEGLKNLQPARHWNFLCWLAFTNFSAACCFHNESQSSVVLTFPNRSPFYTPTSASLTSTLWLLSLTVSLLCALLTALLQQWASYLLITPQKLSAHSRLFLHISIFFFLAGLLVYIYNIHHTLFFLILPAILSCGIAYSVLTAVGTRLLSHPWPGLVACASCGWLNAYQAIHS